MKEPNNQAWRVWETFTKMTFELGLEEVVRAYQVKIIIRQFKNLKTNKESQLPNNFVTLLFVTFYGLKGQQ